MLRNPELFAKYNCYTRRDAKDLLVEYSNKIKWKEDGDRIIDVGCGDGSVTVEVLKKFLPSNYVKLVGLDISEEAVKYANDIYGNNDLRLQFVVHDIQEDLPVKLKKSFDKVFSFNLFHFVPDHKAAFQNTYQLLSDGGTCLLAFMAHAQTFEIYSIMSHNEKWKSWLVNVDQCIPYQFLQDPVAELVKTMKNAGFDKVEVEIQRKINEFESVEFLKQIITALNTFKLSGALLEDFVTDFVRIGIESGLLHLVGGDEKRSARVVHTHDLLLASAAK